MVPVGHVMYELNQRMKAGEVPGYKAIKEVFADGIHLNNVGSYVVGCTFFATFYKENPKGLSGEPYKVHDGKLAEVIQETVWRVVSTNELAGVAKPAPSAFESTTKKTEDQVEVETKEGTAIFTFRCPTGIGGATINIKDGQWPTTVILRLHLGGLESLSISNGKTAVRASVLSHSGNPRLLDVVEDGKEKKVEQDSPYWTEIRGVDSTGKPVTRSTRQGRILRDHAAQGPAGRPTRRAWRWGGFNFYRK